MTMTFGTSRTQRRLRKKLMAQYESQLEQEANGAPTPPDIAARMTKPKVMEELYQVRVDIKREDGHHTTIPCSPKAGYQFCEALLIAINGAISLGNRPGWGNARIEPAFTVS